MVKGPTRITKQTKTLIDMAFTNKPDRITRTYNLITGLSDHNMTLTVRKFTKKRLEYFGKSCNTDNDIKLVIPKSRTLQFERELKNLSWEQKIATEDVDQCCNSMITAITKLVDKFTKQKKCKQKGGTLPWINNEIRKLMKKQD